jgi:organic radical activating enzyme
MPNTIFPIHTATACQLKWAWSTLYLNSGITRSCHRTAETKLTADNFFDFHNTEVKKQDRRDMLQGKWPEKNCLYCKSVEDAGGSSDRMRQLSVPYVVPPELANDHQAVDISPTLLEVYFNNTCNLGCLYCSSSLSSVIESENRIHGDFKQGGIWLKNKNSQYKDLVPYFWEWFPKNFSTISRFHVLGGEPLYQKEFEKLLHMLDQHPNPDCELNIVTNLAISLERLKHFVEKFKSLLAQRKLKRIDITCSIDCWGPQQEYVRWPLDLKKWEENFNYLLSQKYLYLNINQTISVLTIKTMPALLEKLAEWRRDRKIGHWFSEVDPGPDYLKPYILGGKIFQQDFVKILSLMPSDNEENINAFKYMQGIASHVASHSPHPEKIQDMVIYLNEKDRRRNTTWRSLFPWLTEIESHVV